MHRRFGLFVLIVALAACAPGGPTPAPANGSQAAIKPTDAIAASARAATQPIPAATAAAPPASESPAKPTATPAPPTSRPTAPPASPTPEPVVTLAVVGDIMLARSIGERIASDGPDAPLAAVRAELAGADLTIGNLECAIGTEGEPAAKAYRFLAPPAGAQTLASSGFDLVSLANNHILDWGDGALASTEAALDGRGIAHVGAGANDSAAHEPVILERNGLRLAFLAYVDVPVERGGFVTESWTAGPDTPGVAWADPERIAADVAAAQRAPGPRADHVIVLLHSGYEGVETPNAIQRAAADAALGAGATLVLGAHPHVLQGLERRGGGLIAWSLGNFVFDGFEGTPSLDSAILHLTLDKAGVRDLRWTPVRLIDGYPQPLDPDGEGAAILEHLDGLSQALESR